MNTIVTWNSPENSSVGLKRNINKKFSVGFVKKKKVFFVSLAIFTPRLVLNVGIKENIKSVEYDSPSNQI